MVLKKKKIWAIGLGIFVVLGTLVGVLVPVLSKTNNKKENENIVLLNQLVNTKTKKSTINIIQKLYKLKNKTETEINNLASGDIKTKYISALELAKKLFIIKSDYKISLLEGKEKNSNLQEILLIATAKNIKKITNSNLAWPLNQIDQRHDKIAFLITFFKNQVVKVEIKLDNKASNITINNVFFKLKSYDLVDLFYRFKLANPSANDFDIYNAYLDVQNTKGLAIFKNYLLTLKENNSNLESADLEDVKFTKGKINSVANTMSATLSFSYQGLKVSKTINDFTYKKAYELSIKQAARNKSSDEVSKEDINLPPGVTINSITSSTIKPDGSTVKLTFTSGNIREQELGGFVTYEQKAKTLLTDANNSDFSISNKANIFPSEFNDKQLILNQLKAKASSLDDPAKTKVKNIIQNASITFHPNDQTNVLRFQIVIGNVNKSFTITGLTGINTINQKIDAEVAKKTMPSIKNGSEWKNASQVQIADIEITPNDNSLISTVTNVSEKTGLPASDRRTIAIVTIEVSSSVAKTKILTYQVELSGWVLYDVSRYLRTTISLSIQIPIQWNIRNKASILPSAYNDINLIKNTLKLKADDLYNSGERVIRNIVVLKNAIDNKMKIIFNPNDKTGTLELIIKLGTTTKTYTITGFETSSS